MIKFLRLKNFRSIGDREVNLNLKPLTIFVGPSGSGKSNLLYFLDWLYTKTERPLISDLSEEVKGIYGALSFNELIHACKPEEKELEWFIRIQPLQDDLKKLESYVNEIDWALLGLEKPQGDTLGYGMRSKAVRGSYDFNIKVFIGDHLVLDAVQEYDHLARTWKFYFSQPTKIKGTRDHLHTLYVFYRSFPTLSNPSDWEGMEETQEVRDSLRMFDEFCDIGFGGILKRKFSQVYFLTALRGAIESSAELPTSERIGRRGENTLKVLGDLTISDRIDRKEKTSDLMFWCSTFGLRDIVAGVAKGSKTLSSHYRDQWSGLELNLSSASYGCRQILIIIAQVLAAPPESTVLIEEPETSLHPEYQALLPILFADSIRNRRQQIIITTHSSFVALALARAVQGFKIRGQTLRGEEEREFKLNLDDITVYHVIREKGLTNAEFLELSQEGLIKNGIPSFIKTEENLLGKIL
jgi:predicted ATPase